MNDCTATYSSFHPAKQNQSPPSDLFWQIATPANKADVHIQIAETRWSNAIFCCGEGFSYTGSLGGFRIALGHYVAKAFLQNYTRNQSKSLMAKWHQHSVFGLYGTTLATYFSITFSITIWSICPNCINIPLFHYKINHWKSLPPSLVQDILVSESSAGPNLHQSSAMLPTASKERSGGTRKATVWPKRKQRMNSWWNQ